MFFCASGKIVEQEIYLNLKPGNIKSTSVMAPRTVALSKHMGSMCPL
jgi:hypothetical protein